MKANNPKEALDIAEKVHSNSNKDEKGWETDQYDVLMMANMSKLQ